MNKKRYVRHQSNFGEKWEVYTGNDYEYVVLAKDPNITYHYLPRSEYAPCDPPEEWEDVTGECTEGETRFLGSPVSLISHESGHLMKDNGFRVRKIDYLHNGPCFIVERKKS